MRIDNDLSNYSIASVIIGSISLVLWIIPLLAIFVSFVGGYTGIKGYYSEKRRLSKAGTFFSVLSFGLSVLRSGYVYFM